MDKCAHCDGIGEVYTFPHPLSKTKEEASTCPVCEGTGFEAEHDDFAVDMLGELRNRALELCEIKKLDDYEYHKARYTVYGGDIPAVRTVIAWLEKQPDLSETEFTAPDFVVAEIRDQEMLEREAKLHRKNHGDAA